MAACIMFPYSLLLLLFSNMKLISVTAINFIFLCEGLLTTLYQLLKVQVTFVNEMRTAYVSS